MKKQTKTIQFFRERPNGNVEWSVSNPVDGRGQWYTVTDSNLASLKANLLIRRKGAEERVASLRADLRILREIKGKKS